ncbi:MAG: hypothetical protein ACRYFX_03720 [Janthinobacterium lividum]
MPHLETSRYVASPASYYRAYVAEYLVECPRCHHEAVVTLPNPHFRGGARLGCGHCGHAETVAQRLRYRLEVRRNCDTCGRAIAVTIPGKKRPAALIAVPCPHCGTVRQIKPRHEEYITKYDTAARANDPVFNLPLWLQATVKHDVFWAYNRIHLHAIKTYVQATLRERQTNYTTMVERLPTFIKLAKNRPALLKIIENLEKKQAG